LAGALETIESAWNQFQDTAPQAIQGVIDDVQTTLENVDEVTRDTMNSPEGIVLGIIFDPSPGGEVRALANASEAAFRAADNAYSFAVSSKHLPGAGGGWSRFASGEDPNAVLREALTSPNARFLPNPDHPDTFRVVTPMGRAVGDRGETGVRAVVTNEGHVVTWFPVRP
jgi:hypothetical protein